MEFKLNLTENPFKNEAVVKDLYNLLYDFFLNKSYGKSVELYVIGIVCVLPEFEKFYRISKPKYISGDKSFSPDGIMITVSNVITYKIKLDHSYYDKVDYITAKDSLKKELLDSLKLLDKIKIPDFDKNLFRKDFEYILNVS